MKILKNVAVVTIGSISALYIVAMWALLAFVFLSHHANFGLSLAGTSAAVVAVGGLLYACRIFPPLFVMLSIGALAFAMGAHWNFESFGSLLLSKDLAKTLFVEFNIANAVVGYAFWLNLVGVDLSRMRFVSNGNYGNDFFNNRLRPNGRVNYVEHHRR